MQALQTSPLQLGSELPHEISGHSCSRVIHQLLALAQEACTIFPDTSFEMTRCSPENNIAGREHV